MQSKVLFKPSKHFLEAHGDIHLLSEDQFRVLSKCHGKFDRLVNPIHQTELRPRLNTQSDSISAKRSVLKFVTYFLYVTFLFNELLFFLHL